MCLQTTKTITTTTKSLQSACTLAPSIPKAPWEKKGGRKGNAIARQKKEREKKRAKEGGLKGITTEIVRSFDLGQRKKVRELSFTTTS